VTLDARTYSVEWFSVSSRETLGADDVTLESAGPVTFTAPFDRAGPAVLYLKRVTG
jgi:hypothetical protein